MSLADDMEKSQNEHLAWIERQKAKYGDYTGESCPNCGRVRVMLGSDKKRRCQKCAWCIEDAAYDSEFVDYLH